MIAPQAENLLILTPTIGVVSETFIDRHCRLLNPERTSYATFDLADANDLPGPVTALPMGHAPTASVVSRLWDRTTRTRDRRHAQRDVWWVEAQATSLLLQHVHRHGVTCALLEYLDRWLNVIPSLVDAGVRVVVHGHGYDLSAAVRNRATRDAYRSLLPAADAVVVPSEHAATRLRALGIPNVEVVPYGVPLPPPPDAPPRSDGPLMVIAVGRLVPKKDPVGLLHAIHRAISGGVAIELDLFGDGPLRGAVERTVRDLSLTAVVRLHGSAANTQVLAAMRGAHVFAQKSVTALGGDEEGLPLAILEAMAAGLPIVSTRHAGIPEAVAHGKNGLLSTEQDIGAFAVALGAYARDPRLRAAHGAESRRRAEARYSWQLNRSSLRRVLGLDPDLFDDRAAVDTS